MKKIINPWKNLDGYNCFGCAPHNPSGLKMEFFEEGDEIISFWQPSSDYQGWLHTLHGGIQAVLLDEICAWAIIRKMQTTGVTSKMETRYLKPISTQKGTVKLTARITEVRRQIVTVEASILNEEGEICTKAVCTYFTFSREKAAQEMFFEGCETEDEHQH